MTRGLSAISLWRCLLRPRWWLSALLLAICARFCWRELAYFRAASEVIRGATWTDTNPPGIISRIRFGSLVPIGASSAEFRGLVLWKGHDLKSIAHLLPRLRPTQLEAEECMAVDLDALQGLTDLRQIIFRSCPALQNTDGLKGLTGLQYLGLSKCSALQNMDALKDLAGLQDLLIDGCISLRNADSFTGLTSLESLTLMNCSALENVDAIKGLTRLRHLALIHCEALKDVDVIKALSDLKTINLIGCTQLSSSSLREIRASLPDAVI